MKDVFTCTAALPWQQITNSRSTMQIVHPDAIEVGEQEDGWPAGDIVTYECLNCKHRWKVELPQ